MNKKVVVFGTTRFAEVVHSYLLHTSEYEIAAFTVNRSHLEEEALLDLPIVPFEDIETSHPPSDHMMFIAVGASKLNTVREQRYYEAKKKGYKLIRYVHPDVKVWPNNEIGDNTFIFEDNTIQPFVKIGNNVVLWSGNHIGHHSTIDDHTFICSHVVVSGNCKVGKNCFIGVNATLRDTISMGDNSIIGAGALIMKSTKEGELYIPQRTLPRKSSAHDISR